MSAMKRCAEDTAHSRRKVRRDSESAVALLEVILALVLFVAAAAVVTSGLNSALHSLDRQRAHLDMVNLASSILAEIQLGIRSLEVGSAQELPPPWEQFTVELAITATRTELAEAGGLTHVEAIIRHSESTVVHRLSQGIRLPTPRPLQTPEEIEP
ncbi:MAG: hypothetical protein EXS36_16695 [Pedosphaera sp.]|nr:hypothetical protein [Pedosphaera sp.]